MNVMIDSGAIPVAEFVKPLPMVIAGFANAVEEVNRIPPKIQSGT
ncbi:unannotated protein [freshwater metagenome]|uniref:Unannotated protein n=1 Tax=freshwater metagenome TaxID=449393 RepID=A0A6J5ZJB4_9ZZZZ